MLSLACVSQSFSLKKQSKTGSQSAWELSCIMFLWRMEVSELLVAVSCFYDAHIKQQLRGHSSQKHDQIVRLETATAEWCHLPKRWKWMDRAGWVTFFVLLACNISDKCFHSSFQNLFPVGLFGRAGALFNTFSLWERHQVPPQREELVLVPFCQSEVDINQVFCDCHSRFPSFLSDFWETLGADSLTVASQIPQHRPHSSTQVGTQGAA